MTGGQKLVAAIFALLVTDSVVSNICKAVIAKNLAKAEKSNIEE